MSITIAMDRLQQPHSEFFLACAKPDIQKVKRLLDQMSLEDVNRIESDGSTALHVACYRNNAAVVSLLLRNGADSSRKNRFQLTPYEETTNQYIKDLLTQTGSTAFIEWTFLDPPTREMKRTFDIALNNAYNRFGLAFILDYVTNYYIKDHAKKSSEHRLKPRIEQYFENARRTQPPDLSPVIQAYTAPDDFDKILNQHCIDNVYELLRYPLRPQNTLSTSIFYLIAALNFEPSLRQRPNLTFTGTVYRGIVMSMTYFETYKKDELIVNRAFVSTSKIQATAQAFSQIDGSRNIRRAFSKQQPLQVSVQCIYIIRRPETRALDVTAASFYESEGEVLLMPVSAFRVLNVNYVPQTSQATVTLEDCDLPSERDPYPSSVRCDFAEMPKRKIPLVGLFQKKCKSKVMKTVNPAQTIQSTGWRKKLASFILNMSQPTAIVMGVLATILIIGVVLAILLPNVIGRRAEFCTRADPLTSTDSMNLSNAFS